MLRMFSSSKLMISLVFATCLVLAIGENQTSEYKTPENQTDEEYQTNQTYKNQTAESHTTEDQTPENGTAEIQTVETSLSNDTNSVFSNLFTQTNNLLSYLTSDNNEDSPASEDTEGRIALLY